jgi:hypothetical protein
VSAAIIVLLARSIFAALDTCSEYAVLQKMNTLAASEYEAMCNQLKQTNGQAEELEQSCTNGFCCTATESLE